MNERFQNALKGVEQSVPPVWFMRQAGRYHKHYQNLRSKHSFVELCKNPQLAAEVTLGPIDDFDFDVAILFSDLLFVLEALGFGLEYKDSGPELGFRLTQENLPKLKSASEAISEMAFQKEAMIQTRKRLPKNKSLIGFVGGPWTLFGYAVEGSHAGGLKNAKANLDLYEPFCQRMVPLLEQNIELQLAGGAEVVMIFDTAAGELSPQLFKDLVYPQLKQLGQKFPKKIGYYARGVTLDHVATTVIKDQFWAGFGLDHRFDLPQLFALGGPGFIQGNFDQHLLFARPQDFEQHVQRYLTDFKKIGPKGRRGWVSGLGHGVLPHTPEENVRQFVTMVRNSL